MTEEIKKGDLLRAKLKAVDVELAYVALYTAQGSFEVAERYIVNASLIVSECFTLVENAE
jgi:hypothetical protein